MAKRGKAERRHAHGAEAIQHRSREAANEQQPSGVRPGHRTIQNSQDPQRRKNPNNPAAPHHEGTGPRITVPPW